MDRRIVSIFIGCVIMIGSVVGIARIMGNDIFKKPYPWVVIEEYGAAVTIGLPALLYLGGFIVLFGYILFDEDRTRQGARKNQRKKWRKKYRRKHQSTRKP
jgi:hypothetical protein